MGGGRVVFRQMRKSSPDLTRSEYILNMLVFPVLVTRLLLGGGWCGGGKGFAEPDGIP